MIIERRVMSIMLKLININRTDEFIEANYIPEDNNESGYIKIRLSDDEVIEQKLTSYDEVVARYFAHARDKLIDIKDDTNLVKEKLVMWY